MAAIANEFAYMSPAMNNIKEPAWLTHLVFFLTSGDRDETALSAPPRNRL
jgi:hypothetical protein